MLRYWLAAQDLGKKDICEITEDQLPRLILLRKILEAVGDPDREFLKNAEDELAVGIRYPLAWTPLVFEEQLLVASPGSPGYAGGYRRRDDDQDVPARPQS